MSSLGDASVRIEVYSDRQRPSTEVGYDEFMDMPIVRHGTSKNDVEYSKQEIENALTTFKKILGPIDLDMLRVASTRAGARARPGQ